MANVMMTIYPHFDHGDWVFDDEAMGLKREPFVFGMPEMIDLFVKDTPSAKHGFKLYFSAQPFPGYTAELDWVREDSGGNWYRWEKHGMEGWLCPALFRYFDEPPPKIYCRAEAQPHPLHRR